MWRRAGTSDALDRARALLAAKSNKNHGDLRAAGADADAQSRAAPPSGSDVSSDSSNLCPLDSSWGQRGDAAGSRSPSRFLKKAAGSREDRLPSRSKPGSQASALRRLALIERRVHDRQRGAGPRTRSPSSDPSPASRPPSSAGREATRSVRKKAAGSTRGGSSSLLGCSQSADSDEEEMLSQRSPRSASPPPRRDAPISPSSRMASPTRARLPPEALLDPPRSQFSPRRAPSPTCSSGSAPKEILSLEELFPLGCGASQASSQERFWVNVKTLEDVGSAGSRTEAEEPTQVDDANSGSDELRGIWVPTADYQSDFESAGCTESGRCGSSGQVSEHLPGNGEEEEAVGSTPREAWTEGGDASSRPSHRPTPPARSLGRASSSSSPLPGQRLKDAAAQTDADTWPAWGSPPSLPLTDLLKQRLAAARRVARNSRRRRDGLIRSLGPPAYAYATLRQTMELISKTKVARVRETHT
ncbi:uncharacterized protein C19orf44 homolog isoform X2 [Hippocampus zosterae]|uniref:uncharacterized protein C19orf44 homolog isoform X2 n=1 Tax=Hippocampus zosterae TaxID=109293 RepID=UPI00223CA326|nr:uncharacterized protein C19orf44 homolog isoform X2 [Hippocampus zosterae]